MTANAVTATLTPAQQAQAQAQATGIITQRGSDIQTVMGNVAPGGTLDTGKLNALIAAANTATPGAVNPALSTGITTAARVAGAPRRHRSGRCRGAGQGRQRELAGLEI